MAADRLLVPVAESAALRETVEYAVDTALEEGGYVRFVYVHGPDLDDVADVEVERTVSLDVAEGLFNRIEAWADEDAGDHAGDLQVETGHLGTDRYLFSPEDVANAIVADAAAHGVNRVVLDPEYDPGVGAPLLRPLEYELTRSTDLAIEEAPTSRPTRRAPLVVMSSPLQLGVLFGIAFVFYQILSGTFDAFDVVTGAVSGTIVAVGLSRVTFATDPDRRSVTRLFRTAAYVPYLLYEVLKANVVVAAVILHPRLPIDPRLTRIRPAVWGGLPMTTLANSITLTPGTLSVRIDGRTLLVHTLVPSAREDLFDGGLERAVRFLFYGRAAMRIGSLRERGEAEVLQSPAGGAEEPVDAASGDEGGSVP